MCVPTTLCASMMSLCDLALLCVSVMLCVCPLHFDVPTMISVSAVKRPVLSISISQGIYYRLILKIFEHFNGLL